MDTAKVRVKFGNLEVEYEGEKAFVSDGLMALISEIADLSKQLPAAPILAPAHELPKQGGNGGVAVGSLTMGTIAAHLKPDGQQDLIMCALAKLQIIDGEERVEKARVLSEMKHATGYFKASMTSNFSRDLKRMVKSQKINEVANEVYVLTASSRHDLESKLADIG